MRAKTRRVNSDGGFSLIEVIVTIAVMTAVTVPLAAVLYSSMGHLRDSQSKGDAIEIASQQLELIRSLPYGDVGIVGGAVPGNLAASTTSTMRGRTVVVDLAVAYVDDPVPGGFETKADYKQVTVSISFPDDDLKPIVQSTLVAPGGQDGKSLVGVAEVTINEIGSINGDSSVMASLQVHMIGGPAVAPAVVFGAGEASKFYGGLIPNPGGSPSDPDYQYELRLGPSESDRSGSYLGQVWWMNPADYVGAAKVRVLALNSATTTLRVFRAATANLSLTGPAANVALAGSATQSSTYLGGDASRAIDGITDGNWAAGSVSSTDSGLNPYLNVDLGAEKSIDFIRLWNRTDCCGALLSNVSVFVSSNPFVSTDPSVTRADPGVAEVYFAGSVGTTQDFNFDVPGRYVRVQLNGTGVLNLAEVEVKGIPQPLVDFDGNFDYSIRTASSCALGSTDCASPEEMDVSLSAGAAAIDTFSEYVADPGVSWGLMPGNWILKVEYLDRHLTCDASCTALGGIAVDPGGGACQYLEIPISLDPAGTENVDLYLDWTGLDTNTAPATTSGTPEC